MTTLTWRDSQSTRHIAKRLCQYQGVLCLSRPKILGNHYKVVNKDQINVQSNLRIRPELLLKKNEIIVAGNCKSKNWWTRSGRLVYNVVVKSGVLIKFRVQFTSSQKKEKKTGVLSLKIVRLRVIMKHCNRSVDTLIFLHSRGRKVDIAHPAEPYGLTNPLLERV
jgi:hypothetical protein